MEKPVFLIDRRKARSNIERMAGKAARSGVTLRPHVKTHQSAAVGSWLREFGIRKIATSSVDMAAFFARNGWDDILIAVPVNVHQIPTIETLAESCSLHVILDFETVARMLAERITHGLSVWVEMDTGYHRTGVSVEDTARVLAIAGALRRHSRLRLEGLLVHDGHTYSAVGEHQVRTIFEAPRHSLARVMEALKTGGFPGLHVSIGDTPTCSLLDAFPPPISEIRPGNFLFYDLTQIAVGSCRPDEIAAAVACPVISKHPERGEIVLYGGGVHISKEFPHRDDGSACYGRICRLTEAQTGWTDPLTDAVLVSLSQEQGIVRGAAPFLESVEIGDTLVVLPVHVCLTANLYGELYVLGEGMISKFRL